MTTPKTMTNRDRFLRTLRYEPVDRRPLHLVGPWQETLVRWWREGLPEGTDPQAFLGIADYGYPLANVTPIAGLHPMFERKVLREEGDSVYLIDRFGRTVHDFKNSTTIPEWLDFAVKSPADLRKLLDEHFDVSDLDARFPADWADKARAAAARGDIVLIDGGCYYGTLRNVAGVANASYLFYDAPELVDELFERYLTVVMEGLRRAVRIVQIDIIGFGEDIGFKTGPLISPEMFRRFILPRYRKAMDFAHAHGVELTWYDSDGDVRPLIPDYLEVGINGLMPCEIAAGMSPVELRQRFGRALRMGGGVDKREVAKGPQAIDAEIARLLPVIREGGFIPGIDHSIPGDVSWDNYRYYVDAIRKAVAM